ncbi:MAG TPA: methyltransferase domain-containing protein [Gemmataceae bacterium]|nr:methyltransferase domain-containing protein [Gemmataceae bacterium]
MASIPPAWQRPPGVNPGLWDYLHDPDIARDYDASLLGSSLCLVDLQFAERFFDRPARLVDLGCGTGRLLVPFARRGYWVLGVDLSEEMLNQVAIKAKEAGVEVQRLKANLVDLAGLADQTFDYASCLFSTLGMIVGGAQRQRMLEHVHRLLRPGGRFVLHAHNLWFNFWNSKGRKWQAKDLLGRVFSNKEGGDYIMPVHQGIAGLSLHLFTRRELLRSLRGAGFRILEVQPVSLRPDGRLRFPGLFPQLRSYGYLVAAERVKH